MDYRYFLVALALLASPAEAQSRYAQVVSGNVVNVAVSASTPPSCGGGCSWVLDGSAVAQPGGTWNGSVFTAPTPVVPTPLSVSSCGSGAAITGSNAFGTVLEGTVATGCVLTWSPAYLANPPTCVATPRAGLALSWGAPTLTNWTWTNVGTLSSTRIDYQCQGGQ